MNNKKCSGVNKEEKKGQKNGKLSRKNMVKPLKKMSVSKATRLDGRIEKS